MRHLCQLILVFSMTYCNILLKNHTSKRHCNHLVFTDDHSRVILQPVEDDPSSDYINANYIDVSRLHSFLPLNLPASLCEIIACNAYKLIESFLLLRTKCTLSLFYVLVLTDIVVLSFTSDFGLGCRFGCTGM